LSSAKIGVTTGTSLIIANMIGVGVFTTTGYMVDAISSPIAVLVAWLVGGVAALCGALSYAELGAALPRNGGEYQLLSRIFHPALGFVAGWVSLIVGFAAPLAAFAMAFGEYVNVLAPSLSPKVSGIVLVSVLGLLHSLDVGTGSRTHNLFTLGKILLIVGFILAGLARCGLSLLTAESQAPVGKALISPNFAVQLLFVSFAYSGWNTALYVAGEFRRPEHDIPRAVLLGTVVVAVLYIALNIVFLASAPAEELIKKGNIARVAHVAAVSLFGTGAGQFISFLIAVGLVSAASANTMAGARVYEAMGVDYPALRIFTRRRAGGGPIVAIGVQAGLAVALLLTSSFDALITYVGLMLALCTGATVLGVIVFRRREPDFPRPYWTWGYPVTPVLFLLIECWMITSAVQRTPLTAAVSAGTIILGLILYAVVRPRS